MYPCPIPIEDEVGSKEHVHTELISLTHVPSAGYLIGQSSQTSSWYEDGHLTTGTVGGGGGRGGEEERGEGEGEGGRGGGGRERGRERREEGERGEGEGERGGGGRERGREKREEGERGEGEGERKGLRYEEGEVERRRGERREEDKGQRGGEGRKGGDTTIDNSHLLRREVLDDIINNWLITHVPFSSSLTQCTITLACIQLNTFGNGVVSL